MEYTFIGVGALICGLSILLIWCAYGWSLERRKYWEEFKENRRLRFEFKRKEEEEK